MPIGRKRVLLYSPHFVSREHQGGAGYRATPPLSFLALAGPLRDAGYDVRLLDAKWDFDWRRVVTESIESVAAVGITSLTGPSVPDGLTFADFVKSLRPSVPVIWGGWHASFAAGQAIEDRRVDVVVRGMGERAFVEVLNALDRHESLVGIPGLHFKENGVAVATADRPSESIEPFPAPAYELIDARRYILRTGSNVRLASTIFSRGCPYACEFCLDSRNKWHGLSTARMLTDIEFWLARGANRIRFYDGNFFLGRARIVEFCEAILARGLESKFQWIATAVGNRVVQMDDDVLALLSRAGLAQVALGAESGSDELLSRITNKTTVENTVEAVRRLTRHGINQYLFFLVGYPDEPLTALDETLALILRLKEINPRLELNINFTTPLPGSRVFDIAAERGLVDKPVTFEDWGRFDYTHPNLLPITEAYAQTVRRFQGYLSLAFPHTSARLDLALQAPLRRAARWRLRRRRYDWPLELATVNAAKSLRGTIRTLRGSQ